MSALKPVRLAAIALGLLALLLAGTVWAQVSPHYDLHWHVLAGGGSDMASAGHRVRSTLGQFSVGPSESGGHVLGAGYWYGPPWMAQPPGYILYLPLVVKDYAP